MIIPAGRGKNKFALPLPGGFLRVEHSRETLRPVRIAQGGDGQFAQGHSGGPGRGNIIDEIQERSGADSRSPNSIRGPLGSVSVPGFLMVLD